MHVSAEEMTHLLPGTQLWQHCHTSSPASGSLSERRCRLFHGEANSLHDLLPGLLPATPATS